MIFQALILKVATRYGVCIHIVFEHHVISCMGSWQQAGGCVEIVQKSCIVLCSCCAVSADSAQK